MALYDRKDVQQPFVQHQGELASTSLMIEGISCAACGWLIERHLRNLKGVAEANLNLSNHRLNVRWSDAQLPLSELLGELRRIGYAATRIRPTRRPNAWRARTGARCANGVTGLLWMQVMMATMATGRSSTWTCRRASSSPSAGPLLLTTPIVFYCCTDFFKGALRDLRTRHLTMDVSVSLAIGGAYVAGIWSTITGRASFISMRWACSPSSAGRAIPERRARERTAAATAQLVNLLPASCLKLDADGHSHRILLSELQLGDQVLVQPGGLIPADGVILSGQSSVDESVLTGNTCLFHAVPAIRLPPAPSMSKAR